MRLRNYLFTKEKLSIFGIRSVQGWPVLRTLRQYFRFRRPRMKIAKDTVARIPQRFQSGGVIGSANESTGRRLMWLSSFLYHCHSD